MFAGPGQYPPEDFAAYGIVAFRSEPTAQARNRYLAICEGYIKGLPAADVLETRGVPLNEQMATVWPLDDAFLADSLNEGSGSKDSSRCSEIVDSIDIVTSRDAIAKVVRSQPAETFTGDGPYLIAWSPPETIGQPGAAVLIMDLSDVTTAEAATRHFTNWAVDIEHNPDLWRNGWNRERLRTFLRNSADRWGPAILRALGLGD